MQESKLRFTKTIKRKDLTGAIKTLFKEAE